MRVARLGNPLISNMKNNFKTTHLSAIKAAFPHTIPIMAGYLFLGTSYGILMASRGFSFIYPLMTSMFVFAGSMEFALAGLLVGAFAPVEAILLALMINARHIFYGISMLDKYRGMGKKKFYLVFALTDETFSVNYSAEPPKGCDRGLFYFYVSLLNHLYWMAGASIGGIFGGLIPVDVKGIDFAMTALFVVILLEQILAGKKNLPSVIIGVGFSVLSLLVVGASDFIIPAMIMMILALSVFSKHISRLHNGGAEE